MTDEEFESRWRVCKGCNVKLHISLFGTTSKGNLRKSCKLCSLHSQTPPGQRTGGPYHKVKPQIEAMAKAGFHLYEIVRELEKIMDVKPNRHTLKDYLWRHSISITRVLTDEDRIRNSKRKKTVSDDMLDQLRILINIEKLNVSQAAARLGVTRGMAASWIARYELRGMKKRPDSFNTKSMNQIYSRFAA